MSYSPYPFFGCAAVAELTFWFIAAIGPCRVKMYRNRALAPVVTALTELPAGQRRILGGLIFWARVVGLLLIVLGLLCVPGMEFFTGRYTRIFDVAGSLVLLLVGIVWLFGVSMLIRFFDSYLSRN